ncbi:transcriptional regulator, TetR family [Pelagirhabdus alkalitolerans]|uniref:Transcriptional regulator, TetR family n=1 Tax=Pelagirhabdus alkalitolerans TaxID=1612202 RepID=A0A1G6KXX4_9BACI|nr:dihydroxyacetone kinase transcriptional activator DhaS [Pelagirhabdus alkalitolerans]SDC35226.1 transcriptional regulator, TetR family [Pelagirhabdus alkalitolerans]
MSTSIITKKIIANAFKRLMDKRSFDKISVSDIMKLADLRRQTFYYHFQDKFELLEWIYQSETKENITDFIHYERWDRIIDLLFHYFYSNKAFYRNALSINDQNAFIDYLYQNISELYRHAFIHEDPEAKKTDIDILASFYAHGFVGLIKEWIEQDCEEDPDRMAFLIKQHVIDQFKTKGVKSNESDH